MKIINFTRRIVGVFLLPKLNQDTCQVIRPLPAPPACPAHPWTHTELLWLLSSLKWDGDICCGISWFNSMDNRLCLLRDLQNILDHLQTTESAGFPIDVSLKLQCANYAQAYQVTFFLRKSLIHTNCNWIQFTCIVMRSYKRNVCLLSE